MAENAGPMEASKGEIVETNAMERTRDLRCFIPRVDIYKTENTIEIVADMPGVSKDNVEITLEKDVLTINGYASPPEPEGYSLFYSEYEGGDYERSFRISSEIDRDAIEAKMDNGELHLRLPVSEASKTKRIEVKAG